MMSLTVDTDSCKNNLSRSNQSHDGEPTMGAQVTPLVTSLSQVQVEGVDKPPQCNR